jgi:hypothetical protein
VTRSKRLDHGLDELGRISHQGSRDAGFDAIELIVKGGGRHPDGFRVGLIGRMDAGMNPEHDFTHQLHKRGKQELARLLLLGGAGKQVVHALGIQEPFQDGSSHDTDGTLLDKGGKDGVQQHGCHLQGGYKESSNEATI